MPLTFNEFQAELRKREIPGPIAIMLTSMYEQLRETSDQVHLCASILTRLTETVQNVVTLHEVTQSQVGDLKKRMGDDSSVSSVPITDEGDYQ